MPSFSALVTLLVLLNLSACSSRQLYGAGQAWKQKECDKLLDTAERNRCTASNKTSYEDYKRQTETEGLNK